MSKTIEFFYDIVCPYAYLASMQIEQIARSCDVTILWKPVLLGGIYNSIGAPQVPSQQWNTAKIQWNAVDLQRQVQKHNTDFNFHPNHPQRTVEIMRLLSICPAEKRASMSKRLYQAYWVDNIIFPNDSFLSQLAIEYDLPPDCYKSEQAKKTLRENTDYAVSKGLFGVPSVLFDGQLIWGQDRLFFLLAHYKNASIPWPIEKGQPTTIRFYHDFASPYSFLAAMVIDELRERYQTKIEYTPILLGGLFKSIGTPIVPMATMPSQKQQYIANDLNRWAKWWGTDFQWPTIFPMRTILALRVSLVLPAVIKSIYQAYWIRGEDISSKEVLTPLIKEVGASPEEVFQRCTDDDIKMKLRKNTEMAQANQVCGVPSFQIKDQLWWGQDRLLDIAQLLSQT